MGVQPTFFLLMALVLASCKPGTEQAIQTEQITFTKEGELSIWEGETTKIKADFDIEFAESPYETGTGLMYRASMEENQGMLFIFPEVAVHNFYMKNTEFSLDILFIDRDQKIVSLGKNTVPFDEGGISSQYPIKYVLEINGGLSDRLGLGVGDSISFSRKPSALDFP